MRRAYGMIFAVAAALALLCGSLHAQEVTCNASKTVTVTTATDTQILPAPTGPNAIYVCDYEFSFNGTGNAYLETATTGTCGGSLNQIANTWYGVANLGKVAPNAYFRGLTTGNLQLCVNTSAAVNFSLTVYYAIR
jgi:hypothetical protein